MNGGSARRSDNAASLQVGLGTNGGLEGLRASSVSAAAASTSAHDRNGGLGGLAEHARETAGASAGANGRGGGFRGLGEPVTAVSAGGDELEENLRAIAVLDAATEASSGVLPFVNRGGGGESRLGYDQANPYLATMVSVLLEYTVLTKRFVMKLTIVPLTNERFFGAAEEWNVAFRPRAARLPRKCMLDEGCKRPETSLSEVQKGLYRPIVQ